MVPRGADRLDLAQGPIDPAFWRDACERCLAWFAARGAAPRDAVVLVPQAGLIGVLRSAFAVHGGWQPRVETLQTWAHAIAPPPPSVPLLPSLDRVTDRAGAGVLLRSQATGRDWADRDAAGFDTAVQAVVDSAHALVLGAMQRPAADRPGYWSAWREALDAVAASSAGPGGAERWLVRLALEWAASADASALDRLDAQRPSAWVFVHAGVQDPPRAHALLSAADARGEPVLWLDAAPARAEPFASAAQLPAPQRWLADGAEGEAQACVFAAVRALDGLATARSSTDGHGPVGLVVEDAATRARVRALLRRHRVRWRDELGERLIDSPVAARCLAWLRAARPAARRDEWLDALKTEHAGTPALQRLETAWRRGRPPDERAQTWLDAQQAPLREWAAAGERSLAEWLRSWQAVLAAHAPTLSAALADEATGRATAAVLHLPSSVAAGFDAAWQAAAAQTPQTLDRFIAWVAGTLAASTCVTGADASPEVVLTSLGRAALRPFAAVVVAGCDAGRLGAAAGRPDGLLPAAALRRFGLPEREALQQREREAFAQLLRLPDVVLVRRRSDAAELQTASPLVEQAWRARQRLGRPAPPEVAAPLPTVDVVAVPQGRPAPSASQALPERLSASAVDGLRACPYRFFAHSVLGLREAAELDAAVEKREFGTWLHGVLQRFHDARAEEAAPTIDADRAALAAAAAAEQDAAGLDAAELLPFRAAFDSFAEHYLAWLHRRDAEGWRYEHGELPLRRDDPRLGGLALEGRIDRVDVHAASGVRQLVDYKTGNPQSLLEKVAEPLEDTQLAFYAALLAPPPGGPPPRAIYLALDDRRAPREIEHADVHRSAETLVAGLADELARVRAGAGLPALGEGRVCEWCDARGLCRRDHWTETATR